MNKLQQRIYVKLLQLAVQKSIIATINSSLSVVAEKQLLIRVFFVKKHLRKDVWVSNSQDCCLEEFFSFFKKIFKTLCWHFFYNAGKTCNEDSKSFWIKTRRMIFVKTFQQISREKCHNQSCQEIYKTLERF